MDLCAGFSVLLLVPISGVSAHVQIPHDRHFTEMSHSVLVMFVVPLGGVDVAGAQDFLEKRDGVAAVEVQVQAVEGADERKMHWCPEVDLRNAHRQDWTESPEGLDWVNSKACEGAWVVIDVVVLVNGIYHWVMEKVVLPERPCVRNERADEHLDSIIGIAAKEGALLNGWLESGYSTVSVHCHWPGAQACHDVHALQSIESLLGIQYGAQLLVRLNSLTWWCCHIV